MSMSGHLRVKVNKAYFDLYTDWKTMVGSEMHELFFLCACMGYNANKSVALGRQGEQKFWSSTITPEEWACFYAILLKQSEMDPTSVKDDEEVLSVMEDYANGGMELLIEELLSDFIIRGTNSLKLDKSSSKGLAKAILVYISENA